MRYIYFFLVLIAIVGSGVSADDSDSRDDSIEMQDAWETIESHASLLDGGKSSGSVETAKRTITRHRGRDNVGSKCDKNTHYYSIDGVCNNLRHPLWGSASIPLIRELPNAYQDGKGQPRIYHNGTTDPLPGARRLSTECLPSLVAETSRDLDAKHSQIFMQFGQFFSHDLVSTSTMGGTGCCGRLDANGFHTDTMNGGPCYPIPIPQNDRHFKSCMSFLRSVSEKDSDGVSQQKNSATSFVDLSAVYGSTKHVSDSIRSFQKGKLRVDRLNMLPQDNVHKCNLPTSNVHLTGCPNAGDHRVNVWPGLTSMHLVFHREHNRLADKLAAVHPNWTDEKLFQEARRISIAQVQDLVYQEYLPRVLGKEMYERFGFHQPAKYKPLLNPTLTNSFATAAYRFGHTQINNAFRIGSGGSSVFLKDTYFKPQFYCDKGFQSYTQIMQNLLADEAEKVDLKFPEGVTDFLFFSGDASGHSTDLPARNIQRGRDHGLPSYGRYRELALNFFNDSKYDGSDVEWPACISALYKSVRDVDLFLGAISERSVPGGVVGPTFAYLIGHQFQLLREGDRFFYDLQNSAAAFSKTQVDSIKRTSFAGIICRNAGLSRVQPEAFRMPGIKNPMKNCTDIPDVDFQLF